MKWLSLLSRPAHESADPKKRAHAIEHENSAELIQRLPDFARHDRDATVRMNALRRIDDLSLLADRARLDASAEVRALAQSRLRQLLLDSTTAMVQRQRQVRVLDDPALLEEVARQAAETDLRRAAMERIQRPGLIFERCLKDPDPVLRAELLDRIEEPAQLERLAEAARKTDKQLARRARERLTAIQLQRGDSQTIRERAEALCLELGNGLRQDPQTSVPRLQAIEREWAALKPAPDPSLGTRFQGLLATLRHIHDAAQRPLPVATTDREPNPAAAVAADTEATPADAQSTANTTAGGGAAAEAVTESADDVVVAAASDADPELASAALQAIATALGDASAASAGQISALQLARRKALAEALPNAANDLLDQRIGDWLSAAQARQAASLAERSRLQEALRQCLQGYADAVANGQLRQARELRGQAHALLASLAAAGAPTRATPITSIDQDFDQLARWQHWSNDAQRKQLCEQIHASIGSGEHPDAVLNRVKAAQAQWQQWHDAERDPSRVSTAETALDKRFRSLCDQALQPARPYLEKRGELRARKHQDLQAFIAGIEQALTAELTATAAAGLRRQLIERWRELDELSGRDRKPLSERLRQAKEALDLRLQTHHDGVVADKQKFIAQTRRQLLAANGADAVSAAKSAMAKWKTLAHSDRKTDDALWTEFRRLVDPVFAQAQAEQQASASAAASERQARSDILQALRDLATNPADLGQLDTTLAALKLRWQALTGSSRDDERAYDQALAALALRRQTMQSASHRAARQRVLELHQRLLACAAIADPQGRAEACAEWQVVLAEAAIPNAEQKALNAHLASLQQRATTTDPAACARLERLAVQAEILAGIDSPAASVGLRKQLQMERLANRLGGGAAPVASALWLDWLALGGIAAPERAPLDERLRVAFGVLFERAPAP